MPDSEIEVIRKVLEANPRPEGLPERRQRLDALGEQYPLPADVRVEAADANGVKAEWTSTEDADPQSVIMYLHGGGYIAGSLKSHRHMVAQAGREARSRTMALDYRLAPEHPFPAAVEDAVAGYRFLLSHGFPATRIAVAGDSAGGGLAIALLVSLRDAGLPLPACAWCISPWVDLECTGTSMTAKAPVDPMVQQAYLIELAADRKSTRLNSSHSGESRMPSSA